MFSWQAYDDALSRTRTLLGHNLEPTPWHPFPHDKGRPSGQGPVVCALRRLPAAALAASDAAGRGKQCLSVVVGAARRQAAAT